MKPVLLMFFRVACASVVLPVSAALGPAQFAQLPPAAAVDVDFKRDVYPLLEARCVQCHGRGKANGRFSLENRVKALEGGSSGPAIVPGHSGESYLIELVSGLDPDNVMPAKGTRLTAEEVGLLRAWIDQGVAWDEDAGFGRPPARNLTPRRPELPAATAGFVHPLDHWMEQYFEARGMAAPAVVDDGVFIRRVYLDVIGLLPTVAEAETFAADRSPVKREELVRRLLGDDEGYALHWLTFWNDALRNDYQGTGYIDGGRRQITGWLYEALAENLPFDRFVRELVNPPPASAGFINGIIWRGVVNASQTPEMQAAQNISQVFMGVNLKCASCHDSFINDWTLADAYGLAGVYAVEPLEMVHCDKPTGQVAPLRFLYPELGDLDAGMPREARLRRLAELMTDSTNGRLSRTIVNRIWARVMGRGLVEPVDDMEREAWNPDILDWLAEDLVAHGYNLKRTLEVILTSQAYQLPAVPAAEETQADFVFRGPSVRRLSAEQFMDAISRVTGVWNSLPTARADFSAGSGVGTSGARWVWTEGDARMNALPQTVYWRHAFEVKSGAVAAALVAACDNRFKVYLNGEEVAAGTDFSQPRLVEVSAVLRPGRNVVAVEAVNDPGKPDEPLADRSNPAGLIVELVARVHGNDIARGDQSVVRVSSGRAWRWSAERSEGWTGRDFDDALWKPAVELGPPECAPWGLGDRWRIAASSAARVGRVRVALMSNDPLLTALGRPNREQVVTSRPTVATTLQALELTNGETLAGWLRKGAAQLLNEEPDSAEALVSEVYRRALGRAPSAEEEGLARLLVGAEPEPAGVEDLLWAMIMLPEFQLIQ